jgi:hypothetical protein
MSNIGMYIVISNNIIRIWTTPPGDHEHSHSLLLHHSKSQQYAYWNMYYPIVLLLISSLDHPLNLLQVQPAQDPYQQWYLIKLLPHERLQPMDNLYIDK